MMWKWSKFVSVLRMVTKALLPGVLYFWLRSEAKMERRLLVRQSNVNDVLENFRSRYLLTKVLSEVSDCWASVLYKRLDMNEIL